MTLATRRALYLTFIGLFFIITTIVFSYANGYSISLEKKRLVKTGMFAFDTTPKGANIYLNGQLLSEGMSWGRRRNIATPAKIKNLLPGEYEVRFELAGYHPWTKKLQIHSGQSTYAETVYLFRDDKPLMLKNQPINGLSAAQNAATALIRTDNQLELFDLANNSTKQSIVIRTDNSLLSPDGDYVEAGGKVYAAGSALPAADLYRLIGTSTTAISFDLDGRSILCLNGNSAYRLNIEDNKLDIIYKSTSSQPLAVTGNSAYVSIIEKNKNQYYWLIRRNGETVLKQEVPTGTYQFDWLSEDLLQLTDSVSRKIYLADLNRPNDMLHTLSNATIAYYVDAGKILYANDHELFDYAIEHRQNRLLTRVSSTISDIFMHESNNYLIYIANNKIFSLELDERDHRNETELYSFDAITGKHFNQADSVLYVTGSFRNQSGLFRISL